MGRLLESQLKDAVNMAQWIDASPHEWPTVEKIPHLCHAILDLCELTAERDRLLAEVAAVKEDAAMSASSLANTLINATEMLDDISALFPDDAAHKFGKTTGVSLLDDVRDLMTRAESAEQQLEFDRTTCHNFVKALDQALDGRFWLTEGRGSYSWDDDRYRAEFHDAAVALRAIIDPMRKMAQNLSSRLRTTEAVLKARVDLTARAEAAEAALAEERARLDWLETGPAIHVSLPYPQHKGNSGMFTVEMGRNRGVGKTLRAAIDAAREVEP